MNTPTPTRQRAQKSPSSFGFQTPSQRLKGSAARKRNRDEFEKVVAQIGSLVSEIHKQTREAHYGADFNDCCSSDEFAAGHLARNLVRKSTSPVFHDTPIDSDERRRTTIEAWLRREAVNRKINSTRTFGYDAFSGEYRPDTLGDQLLAEAADIVAAILGDAPSIEEVLRNVGLGNGASATLRRRKSQKARKILFGRSVTSGFRRVSQDLLARCQTAVDVLSPKGTMYVSQSGMVSPAVPVTAVAGSIMGFVDKTYLIDRGIGLEPEINGFFQKALGNICRQRLRSFSYRGWELGVNLNTSGYHNSEWARLGSVEQTIATVDGEAASDSITLALCERLLEKAVGWYDLFCLLRSPYTLINEKACKKLHKLEMMSGMGNGFTFELESVLFYAIGLACAMRSDFHFAPLMVSIHGDDLIVPADVFDDVAVAYEAAGVKVNVEKSFAQGPFRESCGGDFHRGCFVTPFYVKTQTGEQRGDWFWLGNSLQKWLGERQRQFLDQHCVPLMKLCAYVYNYASSGEPEKWLTSASHSRRSGLWTAVPDSKGACYKFHNVVDSPLDERLPAKGRYLDWLLQPPHVPTVLELLTGSSEAEQSYGAIIETYERVRVVKFNHFVAPPNSYVSARLWHWRGIRKTGI